MKAIFLGKLLKKNLKRSKNRSVIELCVNDETELYNRFSMPKDDFNNNAKISNDIMNYIETEANNIDLKNALVISIKLANGIRCDLNHMEKLIREYIDKKFLMLGRKIKKLNLHSFLLALTGMMLIGVTQIFRILENRFSLQEFIIVMSWVFMWKAVDLMFFERAELMKEKGILLKIYFSEINLESAAGNNSAEKTVP